MITATRVWQLTSQRTGESCSHNCCRYTWIFWKWIWVINSWPFHDKLWSFAHDWFQVKTHHKTSTLRKPWSGQTTGMQCPVTLPITQQHSYSLKRLSTSAAPTLGCVTDLVVSGGIYFSTFLCRGKFYFSGNRLQSTGKGQRVKSWLWLKILHFLWKISLMSDFLKIVGTF